MTLLCTHARGCVAVVCAYPLVWLKRKLARRMQDCVANPRGLNNPTMSSWFYPPTHGVSCQDSVSLQQALRASQVVKKDVVRITLLCNYNIFLFSWGREGGACFVKKQQSVRSFLVTFVGQIRDWSDIENDMESCYPKETAHHNGAIHDVNAILAKSNFTLSEDYAVAMKVIVQHNSTITLQATAKGYLLKVRIYGYTCTHVHVVNCTDY